MSSKSPRHKDLSKIMHPKYKHCILHRPKVTDKVEVKLEVNRQAYIWRDLKNVSGHSIHGYKNTL